MPPSPIRAATADVASDCQFGHDVLIEADEVQIGPGCRIGDSGDDDFRTPGGVRIKVGRLVLGPGVRIGRQVRIEGGEIRLDEAVRVQRNASLRVLDELHIGAHGTVGEQAEISGRRVEIGQELWMLPQAKVGGGSAFERSSSLVAGHYLHLGVDSLVNTARPVVIGHEVGLGTRTSIYTHGAYPSRLEGFPVAFDGVEIGDFSWLPGAIVNPGVRIGRNVVVGVNSLVTSDLPDGALAAGSPAKVIREQSYPRPLEGERLLDFFRSFLSHYAELLGTDALPEPLDDPLAGVRLDTPEVSYLAVAMPRAEADVGGRRACILGADGAQVAELAEPAWTVFDTRSRHIRGLADGVSERLANELRRYGIRFYSRPAGDRYVDWEARPPSHRAAAASDG